MDRSLIQPLRARGIDVVTALDQNMIARSDQEHLERATAMGRVLYSFNVGGFYRIHTNVLSQNRSHPGMILAQQQHYSVGEQMRRLLILISRRTAEEMKDRVEFLSAWS